MLSLLCSVLCKVVGMLTRPDLRAQQIIICRATDLILISCLISHLTDHLVSLKTNSACVSVKGLFFSSGMCRM